MDQNMSGMWLTISWPIIMIIGRQSQDHEEKAGEEEEKYNNTGEKEKVRKKKERKNSSPAELLRRTTPIALTNVIQNGGGAKGAGLEPLKGAGPEPCFRGKLECASARIQLHSFSLFIYCLLPKGTG